MRLVNICKNCGHLMFLTSHNECVCSFCGLKKYEKNGKEYYEQLDEEIELFSKAEAECENMSEKKTGMNKAVRFCEKCGHVMVVVDKNEWVCRDCGIRVFQKGDLSYHVRLDERVIV